MLTSVNVANEVLGYTIKFPIYEPTPDLPYFITKIDGAGPVRAEINTSSAINSDGTFFQSARVGQRNIVLHITYSPDYGHNQTMQGLRREVYKNLSPKAYVRLRFNNNEAGYYLINGRVESVEPDIFSREPSVVVSILCDDPYFRAPADKAISNYSGTLVSVRELVTADTGFEIELFASQVITGVRVENFVDDDIVYSTDLAVGDRLLISTVRGNKYIRRDSGSGPVNDLDGLTAGGLSMSLRPEVTQFRIITAGPTEPQLYSLRFRPGFTGV